MNCRGGSLSAACEVTHVLSNASSLKSSRFSNRCRMPEKRDMLIVFADGAVRQAPREGETF